MGRKNFIARIAGVALAAWAACWAGAEPVTVELTNGDRLTGDIVEIRDGHITVASDLLGLLTIDTSQVANIDQFLPPSQEPSDADIPPTGSHGYRGIWATLNRLALPEWEKQVSFGWTSQAGRTDLTDLQLRLDMTKQTELSQYRARAEYFLGETEKVVTSDRLNSDFRWRRDLAPGYFYQSISSFGYDHIKSIDQNLEQKFGLGARIADSDTLSLSTGAGAAGRWREYEKDPMEVEYLVDVFQDLDYRVTENLALRQDLRVAVPLNDEDGYAYSFSATLTSNITDALNVSLRYMLDFDKSLDESDRGDRRIVSSLGYRF